LKENLSRKEIQENSNEHSENDRTEDSESARADRDLGQPHCFFGREGEGSRGAGRQRSQLLGLGRQTGDLAGQEGDQDHQPDGGGDGGGRVGQADAGPRDHSGSEAGAGQACAGHRGPANAEAQRWWQWRFRHQAQRCGQGDRPRGPFGSRSVAQGHDRGDERLAGLEGLPGDQWDGVGREGHQDRLRLEALGEQDEEEYLFLRRQWRRELHRPVPEGGHDRPAHRGRRIGRFRQEGQ